MAGEDYSVGTKVTADVSNFEKGMNKAEKSLKGFSDKLANSIDRLGKKGRVGSLGSVGLALGGITSAVSIATKAIKKVSQAIGECTEAFREQNKAEIALETAVKNNPYIDGSSLNSLKQFAGEMQRVSEIGDEQFLPMMAQLIATGRTEAETMDIIRVATDMSATGTMSFETAIQQLNATLNGNIGRLGQQNSELKNLTEEELKSGKAVEILGNKFKGLAEATADTSKQLKNALGDLKENLGRIFETALAPMRKFFTEVISNLNDVLKKTADVKKAMKDVFSEENINIEAPTDSLQIALDEVLKKQREVTANYSQYIQLYGKYIDQTTDETVKAYKEQISDLNRQIKTLSEELIKRRKESAAQAKARKEAEANAEEEKQINDLKEKYLKLIAEQEAKWANIKKVTGEAVKNEERLKFYQEQLVAIMTESGGKITENNQYYKDQMAIIQGILAEIGNPEYQSEWANKLLDQRIEMLETEKEKAIQNAEEEGQEVYSIQRYYNEKILELKLERLENEKQKALSEEGLTAEDKIDIEEYYSNETKKIYDELGDYKKKKGKEEGKDEKSKFAIMLEYAKQYAQKIKQIFSKIVSTIKNVFSSVTNIFKKLFDFNIDDALNAILKWEDNILTFFVETLPALPNFVKSVVQSIKTLLKSIKNVLKGLDLKAIIIDILKTLSNNLPEIVSEMLDILVLIINDAVNGLVQWLGQEQGLKMLLNVVLKIQQGIEKVVTDNLDTIVNFLADNVDTIAEFLAQSMTSANRTLPKIIKAILKLIKTLLDVIAKAFSNQEFVDSIVESLEETINAIIELLPSLVQSFINLIYAIIKAIIPKLPEIIRFIVDTIVGLLENNDDGFFRFLEGVIDGIIALINGLIEALTKDNTLGKALGKIIASLFKKVMDFNFWIDVLSSMAGALGQIIKSAFSGIGGLFGGGSGPTNSPVGNALLAVFTGGISAFFKRHAIGTNNAPAGLSVVGEAGPELVKFRGGEQVLNNRNTNKALAEMGGKTNNFNVTFNNLQDTTAFNMMQQLKAYNRQMAINGVI